MRRLLAIAAVGVTSMLAPMAASAALMDPTDAYFDQSQAQMTVSLMVDSGLRKGGLKPVRWTTLCWRVKSGRPVATWGCAALVRVPKKQWADIVAKVRLLPGTSKIKVTYRVRKIYPN